MLLGWCREPVLGQPTEANRVLALDANGGYVDLPIAPLVGLKEFTIEVWVRPSQFGRHAVPLGILSDLQENALVLWLDQAPAASEFRVLLRTPRRSEPLIYPTTLQLKPGRWYHLAVESLFIVTLPAQAEPRRD
jgi:hypothetical protein